MLDCVQHKRPWIWSLKVYWQFVQPKITQKELRRVLWTKIILTRKTTEILSFASVQGYGWPFLLAVVPMTKENKYFINSIVSIGLTNFASLFLGLL
jgi:hypothetical protein